ncbi:baseplate J/gp47 family protein [Paenibacillus sp. PK4536]|uniref:baseplate J/gp47 family protein n=1 Tax=Paenibacillus sp. PK4536 TaxID=3024576 RepID=UPI0023593401|nr:baseplate J/gp47 family protein [Paenibacillus sp. PK4536]WIM41354.1 baseplate J/gp47 family protein [Paenibacillus sp. PK4536]
MYESQTYEVLLERMLDRVSDKLDKREGSIIYDALAPAAIELAQMYAELDIQMNLSFADTASGEYLERRTAEYGIKRQAATYAVRKGLFFKGDGSKVDVAIGIRLASGDLIYMVSQKLALGEYTLTCETAGEVGNSPSGTLLPLDYIQGLAVAELGEVLVPGEDIENDETLRARYIQAINEQPFGGNISDYKKEINEIEGVGGVKVFPVWQGGGTVKCTIIASDGRAPSSELLNRVQTIIDPIVNQGTGIGIAPIGHRVTITGVQEVPITISTRLILDTGTTVGQVQADLNDIFSAYIKELTTSWKDVEQIIIRLSQLDARIVSVRGIADVNNTKINGNASNFTLQPEQIAIWGGVDKLE